ncbi:MAG: hypothetical protein IIA88_02405 [Bacteroidetes bacterium]|nr:hypothetical protein [Bacteroidota bacterium]
MILILISFKISVIVNEAKSEKTILIRSSLTNAIDEFVSFNGRVPKDLYELKTYNPDVRITSSLGIISKTFEYEPDGKNYNLIYYDFNMWIWFYDSKTSEWRGADTYL